VLVEFGQVPFEVVHTKEFTPIDNPVTGDVFNVGVVAIPLPALTDQIPVPIVGILELSVELEAHIVKSVPAFDVVG